MNLDRLLEQLFGHPVVPDSVFTLKGDASSRRYHRVALPTGLTPTRLVVMELPDEPMKSDEVTGGDTPSELPFVNMARHLGNASVRLPKIYLDATDQGALLLEDLGDDLFAHRVDNAPVDTMRAWYTAAVELLVTMHRSMWPIPRQCVASRRGFDFKLLLWELDHYREWGIEGLTGTALSGPARQQLDQAFQELARELTTLPRGFVHRDYQSHNLMVLEDTPSPANLAVIDFQDALEGPRVYDLVALLNDSYIDVPAALKDEMIALYARRAGIDPEGLAAEFHLVSVQRKLKDGGRFVFIDRVKGNASFLPFVEGSFARVRDSLSRLPSHGRLKAALATADPAHFGPSQ